jgi:two-component system, chemotaxis family, chemotaxis protein CheY
MANKILVVEDEPDSREFLVTLLKLEGYKITTANDGLEALHQVETDLPDLIVSDISMPNLDGIEMVKILRQSPAFRSLPIIVLSAYGSGNLINAINVGANQAMRKPVHAESLLKSINEWLGESLRFKHRPDQSRIME